MENTKVKRIFGRIILLDPLDPLIMFVVRVLHLHFSFVDEEKVRNNKRLVPRLTFILECIAKERIEEKRIDENERKKLYENCTSILSNTVNLIQNDQKSEYCCKLLILLDDHDISYDRESLLRVEDLTHFLSGLSHESFS